LAASAGYSQTTTPPIANLQDKFDAGNTDAKISALEDSAKYPASEMIPLYERALKYLIDTPTLLRGDAAGDRLAKTAISFVVKAKDSNAEDEIWRAFELATNGEVRIDALDALSSLSAGDPALASKLNGWLSGQNVLHQSGSSVDADVVARVVKLLGTIGNTDSFGVVFSAMTEGYGQAVRDDALSALHSMKGDLAQELLSVVSRNRWVDRPVALDMAMHEASLSAFEKAGIATAALTEALGPRPQEPASVDVQTQLLASAASDLGSLGWSPASSLLVESLNRAIDAYTSKRMSAAELVSFINALGSCGTHEAAVRLTLYLDLINSSVQAGRPYDAGIVAAIIANLGRLGDRVSQNDLMFVQYLGYSDKIKADAREAVSNLR
ncbi:MAG TPA: hypothetical protein VMV68_01095, partial [Spirochaetia bacterium]|nr:hypothetical protein [Spirochaetia bacterium]